MKLSELIAPKITWRQNGDMSWNVRVDYGNDRVFVHTNKNKKALEKLVNTRYKTRTFVEGVEIK